ncbi:MAG: hypothetical protein KFH87_12680 [Bacteroidetes bacterium]|nr:hypothetical protein [Bacteroidota bacterium]
MLMRKESSFHRDLQWCDTGKRGIKNAGRRAGLLAGTILKSEGLDT